MKFSVLIAAYQAEAFILTALECLREQSHHNWEVIVVEDGSHDHTEAIVKEFAVSVAQPVRYHNLGKNCGVGTARNTLLSLASGEAIAFLDADDTWEPSHLANAQSKIEAGADFVVSGVQTFDLVQHRPLAVISAPVALLRDPVLALFRESVIITSSAVILTQELAHRTGEFDTSLRIGEDRDYWLRCALAGGRFQVSKAVTCNYAKHDGSSMARTYLVAQQVTRFYEKHRSLKAVPASLRRHLLADSLIALGRLLRSTDATRSAWCFWRAWQCEPFNPRIACHLMFTGWRSLAPQKAA